MESVIKQPELGNKVLELRLKRGFTQAELAEKTNLSLRTIQRIESGEVTPRNYTIKVIFECLDYNLAEHLHEGAAIAGGNDRENRIERAITYVKELFNLKTNTMKKLSVLSLFAIMLFAGLFVANNSMSAQSRKLKSVSETLTGTWQQVVLDPETGQISVYIPYLKTFNADGTYTHMSAIGGIRAFLNASGRWKVTSDKTFLEYVDMMYGDRIRNHTEEQTFRLENRPDGLYMHSSFHTQGTDMPEINETWVKCDYVPRDIARESLEDQE